MSTVKKIKWHKLSIYKVFLSIPVLVGVRASTPLRKRMEWRVFGLEKRGVSRKKENEQGKKKNELIIKSMREFLRFTNNMVTLNILSCDLPAQFY